MSYRCFDIEVSHPLPTLQFGPSDTGVAVLARLDSRPLAFWMEPLAGRQSLSSDELSRRISAKAGARLLGEKLRRELAPVQEAPSYPSLTITICTRDRPESLERCLHSIDATWRQSKGGKGFERPEVLVIDNAPSDSRSQELVHALPWVRYIREPRPGLDFARNRALHEATGELLAFLDDDVVMDPGWPNGLAEAWAENPDAAAITGLILPYELSTEAQILFERAGGFRPGLSEGFDKIRFTHAHYDNWRYPFNAGVFGAGANMVFQRQLLLDLGGFDDALDTGRPLPGGGDLDAFYRIIQGGRPLIYEPRCLVFHDHRRDIHGLERQYWSWGVGFMTFIAKVYANEVAARPILRRVAGSWFKEQVRQLVDGWRGRGILPPNLVINQLLGGFRGWFGEYRRSLRRIRKIREEFG